MVAAVVAGGAALPLAGAVRAPVSGGALNGVLAAVALGGAAAVATFAARGARGGRAFAYARLAAALLLTPWANNPLSMIILAALAGSGAGGLLAPARELRDRLPWTAAGAGVVLAVSVAAPSAAANGLGLFAAALAMSELPALRRASWRAGVAAGAASLLAAGFAAFWVGSTAPRVTWFGQLTYHGSRAEPLVALTFDDGPNTDSLPIAQILRERGVQATFFEVGKAVRERPDIMLALLADGNVIGDHSYHHDAWRYLDPGYAELDRTQREIFARAGVCPAFFRPPHGTHTPFMSHEASKRGMTLATWDVSAADWVEHDPARLSSRIVARARPGSIILLHDGLDGHVGADRSVVVAALPAIIDGLRAKGLQPVTLDVLLHRPAYLDPASCGTFQAPFTIAPYAPAGRWEGIADERRTATGGGPLSPTRGRLRA